MSRQPFDPDCGLDIATTTIRELEDIATIQYFGFRVILHPDGVHYIHEAYYDHREGLLGVAQKPAEPCADSLDALGEVLELMEDALREPILRLDALLAEGRSG
jgi:hypothetical protein